MDNPYSLPTKRRGQKPAPPNTFQRELEAKMRERRQKGLVADITPNGSDYGSGDELASDDDLLAQFNMTSKPDKSSYHGSRKSPLIEDNSSYSRRSPYDDSQSANDIIFGRKSPELYDGYSDSRMDPLNMTMKKPWQPQSSNKGKSSSKNKTLDSLSEEQDMYSPRAVREPWQPPSFNKTSLAESSKEKENEQPHRPIRPKSPSVRGRKSPIDLDSIQEEEEKPRPTPRAARGAGRADRSLSPRPVPRPRSRVNLQALDASPPPKPRSRDHMTTITARHSLRSGKANLADDKKVTSGRKTPTGKKAKAAGGRKTPIEDDDKPSEKSKGVMDYLTEESKPKAKKSKSRLLLDDSDEKDDADLIQSMNTPKVHRNSPYHDDLARTSPSYKQRKSPLDGALDRDSPYDGFNNRRKADKSPSFDVDTRKKTLDDDYSYDRNRRSPVAPDKSPGRKYRSKSPLTEDGRSSPAFGKSRKSPFREERQNDPLDDDYHRQNRKSPLDEDYRGHRKSPHANRSRSRERRDLSPEARRRTPYGERREGSPYRDRRQGSPYRDRREGSPYRDRREGSPYRDRREGSPYRDRREGSPHRDRRQGSPYRDRRGTSPSGGRYRDNDVGAWSEDKKPRLRKEHLGDNWYQMEDGDRAFRRPVPQRRKSKSKMEDAEPIDQRHPRPRSRSAKEPRSSSLCREVEREPSGTQRPVSTNLEHTNRKPRTQRQDRQVLEEAIDSVEKAQGGQHNRQTFEHIEPDKDPRTNTSKSDLTQTTKHRPQPRYARQTSAPTSGGDFNSTTSIRETVYQDWLATRTKSSKKNVREKKLKQEEEEKKAQQRKQDKADESKLAYEAWIKQKKESGNPKLKKQQEEEEKKNKEEEEKLEKKKEAETTFNTWKEDKDIELKEQKRKKRREEEKLKREAEYDKADKKDKSESAFSGWKGKKDKNIVTEKRGEKKTTKQKEAEEKEAQRSREKAAIKAYNRWMEQKEKRKEKERQERRRRRSLEESELSRPAWSPAGTHLVVTR